MESLHDRWLRCLPPSGAARRTAEACRHGWVMKNYMHGMPHFFIGSEDWRLWRFEFVLALSVAHVHPRQDSSWMFIGTHEIHPATAQAWHFKTEEETSAWAGVLRA